MADMIVDGAKLDACLEAEADAIRAKTGGSADIPFDFANNKGFADAIAAIPSGGGMEWELIADYTSDEAAEIVVVTIPSGKQDSNVYRFQFNSNGVNLYYPYLYANNAKISGYFSNGNRAVNCVNYVVKRPLDNSSEVGGTTPPTGFSAMAPNNAMNGVPSTNSPLVNFGMQAYNGYTIPAGLNIKIWRLVES